MKGSVEAHIAATTSSKQHQHKWIYQASAHVELSKRQLLRAFVAQPQHRVSAMVTCDNEASCCVLGGVTFEKEATILP